MSSELPAANDKLLAWPGVADPSAPLSGNKRRRGPRKGETRAKQVVEVALHLFHEQGYAGTSMDDIATAVGLLKGSLYYYVNSKEDLLFRIVEHVHENVTERLERAVSRDDLTPLERIVEFVRLQLCYNASHVTELAVYHHDWGRLESARRDEIHRRRLANEATIIELIDQAKSLGEVPDSINPRLAVAHTTAVMVWPHTWYNPRSRVTADQLADSGAEFVRRALAV